MNTRTLTSLRRASCVAFAAVSMLSLLACEADFDKPSKLNSLRVLAVKADKPYPKPGDTVSLEMLWHDGKVQTKASDGGPPTSRNIQVLWIGGCFNPVGDLYYGCYPSLGKIFAAGPGDPSVAKFLGSGDTFKLDIPSDIISQRPTKEGVDPYGLSYVFFAVCAGKIGPSTSMNFGLPLGCFDAQGKELGAEDFVPGYFSLYSYNDRTNANPIVTGLEINGSKEESITLPACKASPCPEYDVRVLIDPASAEVDPGGTGPNGETLTEQMWVDYYASDGAIGKGVRLVNDATKGWNDDNGTTFQPPWETKTVSIYSVVHDNRGGIGWVKRDVSIQ